MGRIVVTEYISLDAVIEPPGGTEDYPDAGGGTTMAETSGTGPNEEIISRATS